jgi:ribosomal protein S6
MLTVDMFPINERVLPEIYLYEIETSENKNSISGKLAYRMKKEFKGHWASSNYGRIITDISVDEIGMNEFLKKLWQTKNILFNNVRNIRKKAEFKLSEYDVAAFVARGLLTDTQKEIIYTLNKDRIEIQNAIVKRVNEFGGYVVNNKAAVSISISSNILLKQDLDYHIRKGVKPVGLYVKVKHQSMKGEVSEVVGSLNEHRERLLTLAQDEESLRLIEEATDDTYVVTVRSGKNFYDYTANSLEIVLTLQNCSKFGVLVRSPN